MADNKQAGLAVGAGPTFATDEIAGIDYPRAKLVWGVDGTATDASASNPLPVVQTGTPALPTGASTEATLSAMSVKLPASVGQKAMAASFPVVVASDQGNLGVNDGGTSLTMDFTGQKTTDMDTGAGVDTVLGVGILLPASGGSVQGGTATNPLRTDPTGTTTQPVSVASLPLPSGAATETTLAAASGKLPATLGQKTMANSMAVALASDQGNIGINDGGTSLTMDSPQLPATLGQTTMANSMAVVLASNQASIPVAATLAAETTKVIGTVNVAASQTIATTNAGTFAVQDSEKVVDNAAFTDGTTKVLPAGYIYDEVAGTALTENDTGAARMDSKRALVFGLEDATTRGQRQAVNAGGAAEVHGDGAHGASVAGNPVLQGLEARTTDGTVVTSGQAVRALADTLGKQVVLGGSVNDLKTDGKGNFTTTTAADLIAAAGAGVKIAITHILVINAHATVGTKVEIRDGTTVKCQGYAPALGGGFSMAAGFGPPLIISTANAAITGRCVTTGADVDIFVSGYTFKP